MKNFLGSKFECFTSYQDVPRSNLVGEEMLKKHNADDVDFTNPLIFHYNDSFLESQH